MAETQDMEQIEEWNEYGELEMEIEDFDEFSGLASASNPPPNPVATGSTKTAPTEEDAPPKQSKIKIQTPASNVEGRDDHINMTLRQASQEAASKAKETTRAKLDLAPGLDSSEPKKEMASTSEPAAVTEVRTSTTTTTSPTSKEITNDNVHKESQSENEPGSEWRASQIERPAMPTEVAVQSSDDIRADDAQSLGVLEHHRSDKVSATSPGEQAKVASDIRKSISEEPASVDGALKEQPSENVTKETTVEAEEEPREEEAKQELENSGPEKSVEEKEDGTGEVGNGEHEQKADEQKEEQKGEPKEDTSVTD